MRAPHIIATDLSEPRRVSKTRDEMRPVCDHLDWKVKNGFGGVKSSNAFHAWSRVYRTGKPHLYWVPGWGWTRLSLSFSRDRLDCGCDPDQPCAMKTDGSCWRAD